MITSVLRDRLSMRTKSLGSLAITLIERSASSNGPVTRPIFSGRSRLLSHSLGKVSPIPELPKMSRMEPIFSRMVCTRSYGSIIENLYAPCAFCCSSEVNSTTGPLGMISPNGEFNKGYFFTQKKDHIIAHWECILWVYHHKLKGTSLGVFEIDKLDGSACTECRQLKAFLTCSTCDAKLHLLCASKSGHILDKEKYRLTCKRDEEIAEAEWAKELAIPPLFPVPPKNLIARKKVFLLTWYYIKGVGFVLHGLWIGERDSNGKLILLCNKVRPDRFIHLEPLYKDVISMLDRLPTATIDLLNFHWISQTAWRNPRVFAKGMHNRKYPVFWISQLLKHGVQDGVILLPDYYEILFKLCNPFISKDSPESLSRIINTLLPKQHIHGHQLTQGDLVEAISNIFGKNIELEFKQGRYSSDPWKPSKLSFLNEENGDKADHPSPATGNEEYIDI